MQQGVSDAIRWTEPLWLSKTCNTKADADENRRDCSLGVDLCHVFDAVCLFALAALPVLLFAALFALAVHYLMSKLRWAFNP